MTARQLLPQYSRDLATPPQAGINVAVILENLAAQFPQPDLALLDQLCRKLAVAKDLSQTYADQWKKAPSQPLSQQHWDLLVILLLAHAELPAASDIERARSLKYLDSALKALDLRPASSEARPIAEKLLESL